MPSQYDSRRPRATNPHASPPRDAYEEGEAAALSPLITGLFSELVREGVASGALDPATAERMAERFGASEPANDNDGGER